jgi:hypothetical protein
MLKIRNELYKTKFLKVFVCRNSTLKTGKQAKNLDIATICSSFSEILIVSKLIVAIALSNKILKHY